MFLSISVVAVFPSITRVVQEEPVGEQTVVTRHTITNGKNNRPIFTLHLLAREKREKVYNHPPPSQGR